MPGTLYLCATPIGNLGDITLRCLETLRSADLIAAEDTRNTLRLLNHFEIKKPLTSYHEYNKVEKARVLVDKLRGGVNIALVTDAGTPGISDPGEELVRQCREAEIPVTSVPGPAACISALVISGLPTRRFAFEAFLPEDKKERARILEELSWETRTMVIYEAPHNLIRTLHELADLLGDRDCAVCRELTKIHETVFRTTLPEAAAYYDEHAPKGECVIVIRGKDPEEIRREREQAWEAMSIPDHVKYYLDQGKEKKEAMRLAAKDRGISRREVYAALLRE
ncbi:16S rRNA (cytidine(1402)-2'-O)-methyltransferase [Clostridium vitabionis]|uniref:16S rRNA (cytidine(1402)-2'-O)-methyltransferase n=1 Tax=Clostridium vitabionis TaxID=2784388 RepID=UPI001889D487|nr:16S rRNA (cytidine(1402)-2'-O)-methyltransferase [Clostridium vitabionis]